MRLLVIIQDMQSIFMIVWKYGGLATGTMNKSNTTLQVIVAHIIGAKEGQCG